MAHSVQLSRTAYSNLRAHKRDGESFSDVINRILRERKDPLRLLDLRGQRDPEMAEWLEKTRQADEERDRFIAALREGRVDDEGNIHARSPVEEEG